jgi:hypothetical protein
MVAMNNFMSAKISMPLFQATFLLGLLFDPEDGSDMFPRNAN